MSPEAIVPERVQESEQNLTASLKYSELLYSQLKHHVMLNTHPLRDLAMCMSALIEWERAVNRGEVEHDLAIWAESIAVLTTCVANRLGCEITMTPSARPQEASYYEVEFLHPERGPFVMRFLLPSQTSVASYAHVWEVRNGAKLVSVRPITEEEYRSKSPRRLKLKVVEQKKEECQKVKIPTPTPTPAPKPLKDRKTRFSPEEVVLLDRFEETGVLKAFTETQAEVSAKLSLAPAKDIEDFFLKYLRAIVPYDKKIPQPIREQFALELGGEVTCYQANQIVMIVSTGEVRRFVPLLSITSTGDRPTSINVAGLHVESKTPLTIWGKTGYGYVPPDQHLFFESLLHSVGSFGRQMKETPIHFTAAKATPPPKPVVEEAVIDPPFDLTKAQFTPSALMKFAELVRPKVRMALEKEALAILAKAKEEGAISPEGIVRRTIKHHFEEARYFKHGRYRFVVKEDRDNDVFKILTVEEILPGRK